MEFLKRHAPLLNLVKKKMLFQQELDSGQGTCDKKRRCG